MAGLDDDQVMLLGFWASPFVMRVKIALAEKGIEYESREEDFINKSSLLLEMNPVAKRIPVLIHKGNPICESMIIVEYIDEVWNHTSPNILPTIPYEKAKARFWADFVDKKIFEIVRILQWAPSSEDKTAESKDLIENLRILEGELGDKPYFGGDELGFVDVVFGPICSWFYAFEKLANFSREKECPKIVEWTNKCLQKPSFYKSTIDEQKVYDLVVELKKKLG